MTNDELEAAFTKAQNKWLLANPHTAFNANQQRYFFWEGGNFGVEASRKIYRDTYRVSPPDEDIDGAPV